ncbi:MAG: GrpB family protein [Candidatus Pacebacteria bacterium]|jgi:GrpB-like predicted nucleotidyltransferase (UPF0157 family)|nr:hypothetical protein [Parcubacteria group bacterium]MDP6119567.1 GrpB family protein [Candidatus Paceibacterota bacterium]
MKEEHFFDEITEHKKKKRPYSLVSYTTDWNDKFEEIKKTLEEVFRGKAMKIVHVGSTAIPEIKAKPIVDILLIVPDVQDLVEEKEKMVGLGYEYQDNYIQEGTTTFWKSEDNDQKTQNIHVCFEGSEEARHFIEVTSYLKEHPEKAKEYEDLKIKLNEQHPNDYPAYRKGKNGYLKELEVIAKEWWKAKTN